MVVAVAVAGRGLAVAAATRRGSQRGKVFLRSAETGSAGQQPKRRERGGQQPRRRERYGNCMVWGGGSRRQFDDRRQEMRWSHRHWCLLHDRSLGG